MSNETVHYMESTSRLRAENEDLRKQLREEQDIRSVNGGVHCAPPSGPTNTCYRWPDGSCESCGYPPPVVDKS